MRMSLSPNRTEHTCEFAPCTSNPHAWPQHTCLQAAWPLIKHELRIEEMAHKTDGELGRITTSFEVQCISHGKVPARAIRKSSVGHGVFKKHALGCTCALVSIGSSSYSHSSFVNAIGPRLSPRMHQTHTALPKKTVELPLYVFALSTCLSKTRLAFRLRRTHVGDLVRLPAKLGIRRNRMHVTMSAAFKPQRNMIFRKQHRLLCGPIQKEEMHTYLTQVLLPRSTPTYAIQPNPITPHTSVPSHTIHLLVTMLRTKTWNFFVLDAHCLSHSLSPSLFSSCSIYPEVCSAIPNTN